MVRGGTEAFGLERLLGNLAASFPASPTDLGGLYKIWQQVASRRQDWLVSANPEAGVAYHFTDGKAHNSAREIVLHYTSHTHFHRGQLASQFIAPFTDLATYPGGQCSVQDKAFL
ncbi:MAG: hypothetical protein N2Z75_01105 [Meiothermus sp.]|uniref:hypothetical protein n=1 Tax=Meiothermus sp. TaxID=1955249 RepID=UPI0025CEC852|nr:hypothetical protein [Meiothermus sp.]MCS7067457.1 hypothetical protein [Meiothermus sp.]MCX7600518.1 hypothetical protein [Meiothermus sp.]